MRVNQLLRLATACMCKLWFYGFVIAVVVNALANSIGWNPWDVMISLRMVIWSVSISIVATIVAVSLGMPIRILRNRFGRWVVTELIYVLGLVLVVGLGRLLPTLSVFHSTLQAVGIFTRFILMCFIVFAIVPSVSAVGGLSTLESIRATLRFASRSWPWFIIIYVINLVFVGVYAQLESSLYDHGVGTNVVKLIELILDGVVSGFIFICLAIPAVSVAGYDEGNEVKEVPSVTGLIPSVVSASVTAFIVCSFVLVAVPTEIHLMHAFNLPIWIIRSLSFLPVSPALVVIFLIPALASGWMAERKSGVQYSGIYAGGLYGAMLILSSRICHKMPGMGYDTIIASVIALLLYTITGYAGAWFSHRHRPQ